MGVSVLRTLGIGVLCLLLVVSLLASNAVIGVERTVLDEEFVVESLAEEDVYVLAVAEVQTQLTSLTENGSEMDGEPAAEGEGGFSPGSGEAPDMSALLGRVVTSDYVQGEVETNLGRTYAYLHGQSPVLNAEIDTTPVKDGAAQELAALLVENLSSVDPTLATMAANESAFQMERERFEARQLARIQNQTDEYLSEAELRARYDEQRPEIRARLLDAATSDMGEDIPPELEDAVAALVRVRVDALVSTDATYESFTSDLGDAKAKLEDGVASMLRAQLDEEIPDTIRPVDEMDAQARADLENVRFLVGVLDLLQYALPALAVVLAGLIAWLSRTRSGALAVVGGSTILTGAGSVGGLLFLDQYVRSMFEQLVGGGVSPDMAAPVLGIYARVLGVFTTQSWMLVGVGVTFIGGAIAVRIGVLPVVDDPHTGEPTDTGAGEDVTMADADSDDTETNATETNATETNDTETNDTSTGDIPDTTPTDKLEE